MSSSSEAIVVHVVPDTSLDSLIPAASSSPKNKGLLKKLRKQLASGRGPNSKTLSLLASPEAASLLSTAACSAELDARAARHGVTVAQVRDVVMQHCAHRERASPPQPFLVLGNAQLLRVIVVLLIHGVNTTPVTPVTAVDSGEMVKVADALPTSLDGVRSTHVWHKRGRSWGPFERTILPAVDELLYVDEADDDEEGGEEENEGEEESPEEVVEEEDDAIIRVGCGVLPLTLRLRELAAHDFPLVDAARHVANMPPIKSDDDSTLPEGRVAGAPHGLRCTLGILPGFLLTRTAHADFHAALGALDCPLLLVPNFISSGEGGGALIALDCEMCGTAKGSQLARVSVVVEQVAAAPKVTTVAARMGVKRRREDEDSEGEEEKKKNVKRRRADEGSEEEEEEDTKKDAVGAGDADTVPSVPANLPPPHPPLDIVLDDLVIPLLPILDYRTQWSGMTAARVSTATLTFSSAQDAVAAALDKSGGGIAVGHSLEADFWALRIIHSRISDTSLIYRHPNGPPRRFALRVLAERELGRIIQVPSEGESRGHDSVEDARAARDLVVAAVGSSGGGGGGGGAGGGGQVWTQSHSTSLVSGAATWARHFTAPAREGVLPAAHGGGLGRGAAGALAAVRTAASSGGGGPSMSSLPAVGRKPKTPVVTLADTGVSIIGSQSFVRSHVVGAAAGVVAGDTLSGVTEAVIREASRMARAQEARVFSKGAAASASTASAASAVGGSSSEPCSLIFANACAGDTTNDYSAARAIVATFASQVPKRVLVIAVTQASKLTHATPYSRSTQRARLSQEEVDTAAAARKGFVFVAVGRGEAR